ncbi:MAG: hypothetical protein JO061_02050 [Acidobacteriaceae bacterium]|nr:hypothetical protein [Acidobacteriaceae bacterium]
MSPVAYARTLSMCLGIRVFGADLAMYAVGVKPPTRYYALAAFCIVFFLLAQAFQELAYIFWIPKTHGPAEDLLVYLLRVDQSRALGVMGTLILLIVPYAVVALRYFAVAQLASLLGLISGTAFIGFEMLIRSIDFFAVGGRWAHEMASASPVIRDLILSRFALWNDAVHGLTFPLRMAAFLASCSFALASSNETGWYRLGQAAFVLNALRLLGRLVSSYAGQAWLDSLNDSLYFPGVFAINAMLIAWFVLLWREDTLER